MVKKFRNFFQKERLKKLFELKKIVYLWVSKAFKRKIITRYFTAVT